MVLKPAFWRVHPGRERGTGDRADRRAGKSVIKNYTVGRKLFHGRHRCQLIPVNPRVVNRVILGNEKDEIRAFGGLGGERDDRCENEDNSGQ